MNYQRIYDNIVNRSLANDRKKYPKNDSRYKCYERHHIIPKSMGGSDEASNLVLLTPEEHLLLHLCLVKIYPKNHALIKAAMLMGTDKYGNRINNKQYGWVRKQCTEVAGPTKGQVSKRKGRVFGKNKGRGRKIENTDSYLGRTPWNKGIKTGIGGSKLPQDKVICPKCNVEGGLNNMKRYHFDNCKDYTFGKQKGYKN